MNCKTFQSSLVKLGVVAGICIGGALLHLFVVDEVAFWTAATAIATGIVGLIAWYQIGRLERAQKGWETLRICNLYDLDPTLAAVVKKVRDRKSSKSVSPDYGDLRNDLRILLNYFDSLAIGISQGFYLEEIAQEHLGGIMTDYRGSLFSDEWSSRIGIDDLRDRYGAYIDLAERWQEDYA